MASKIKNKGIISFISSGIAVIILVAVLPLGFGHSQTGFKVFTVFYFISIALAMVGGFLGVMDIHNPKKNPAALGLFLTFAIFIILLTISLSLIDVVHGF